VRFVVEGSMDREALDECVEYACGGRVEVLLERSSAAGHPGVGDIPVGGIPSGQCVELVCEDQVALVAEYDVSNSVGDCLLGGIGVVGGRDSFIKLLTGGLGEPGEGLVEQVVHPGEVVGHGPEWDVGCLGDLAM
jgi:hypothetical protein